jgi:hypothetical protein
MKLEELEYPIYRKYKNNKSYFKIMDPRNFVEIQLIGSQRRVLTIKVKQYPEMVFIRDLIMNYSAMAENISEDEYERQLPPQ